MHNSRVGRRARRWGVGQAASGAALLTGGQPTAYEKCCRSFSSGEPPAIESRSLSSFGRAGAARASMAGTAARPTVKNVLLEHFKCLGVVVAGSDLSIGKPKHHSPVGCALRIAKLANIGDQAFDLLVVKGLSPGRHFLAQARR